LWPNGWMGLGMEVGLGPGDIVLDQDPAPRPRQQCQMGTQLPPKKGHSPTQFWTHVYCSHTAGSIKMPLSMEVGLGPGDFVFDGDPALPQKGA